MMAAENGDKVWVYGEAGNESGWNSSEFATRADALGEVMGEAETLGWAGVSTGYLVPFDIATPFAGQEIVRRLQDRLFDFSGDEDATWLDGLSDEDAGRLAAAVGDAVKAFLAAAGHWPTGYHTVRGIEDVATPGEDKESN